LHTFAIGNGNKADITKHGNKNQSDMKALRLFAILSLGASLLACSEEELVIERPAEDEDVIPALSVATESLLYYAEESSRDLTFSATSAWKISVDQNWVSVSSTSGNGSDTDYQVVSVKVAANSAEENRNATLTLSSSDGSKTVAITQYGYVEVIIPELSVETESLAYTCKGGSDVINFTTNVEWTAETDADWLTLSPTSGSGLPDAQTINVGAAENTEYNERSATITISVDGISQAISVSQEAAPTPAVSVSPNNIIFAAAGSSEAVSLAANYAWTASVSADWLSLSATSGNASESAQSLTLTATENEETEERTASVVFTLEDGTTSATLSVVQSGAEVVILEGYYSEEFNSGSTDWVTATKNATYTLYDGYFYVTPAEVTAGTKYRGDIKSTTSVSLNAKNYPIFAFCFDYVGTKNSITLDGVSADKTSYKGALGNGSNKQKYKYQDTTEGSSKYVYAYDLSSQKWGTSNVLPTDGTTVEFTTFQIKYADIYMDSATPYNFYWIKTFESLEALEKYMSKNGLNFSSQL